MWLESRGHQWSNPYNLLRSLAPDSRHGQSGMQCHPLLRGRGVIQSLTSELANSKSPPIGANIILITKNKGRTVLGVRIGLEGFCQLACDEIRSHRNLLPRLQSLLAECSI